MLIQWPSFKEYYTIFGSPEQELSEFIELVQNEKTLIKDPIVLDPKYYNVLLNITTVISEFKKIITDKAHKLGKKVRIYKYETSKKLGVYYEQNLPIIENVNFVGNFDLVVVTRHLNDGIENGKRFKCDVGVITFNNSIINLEIINYENLPVVTSSKVEEKIKTNFKLGQFLDYVDFDESVFEALDLAIREYLEKSEVNFILDASKVNILVLCADDHSIKTRRAEKLINNVLGEVRYENTDFYYVGYNILNEELPFIRRGSAKNVTLFDDLIKFDIILVEHCDHRIFNTNAWHYYSILKDDGIIVSPEYSGKIDSVYKFFNLSISKRMYIALSKKNIDEINFDTELKKN